MIKHPKNLLESVCIGVVGAIAGVTCCVAPVVLILLGFGTAFGMAFMHEFHAISLVSAIIFMILLSLYLIKRKKGICNLSSIKEQWKSLLLTIAVMMLALFVINYVIVMPVASYVYGNLPFVQKPQGNYKEMMVAHGMVEEPIEVIPEHKGMKQIALTLNGLFCGSCGPAVEYDIKSITGVKTVDLKGSTMTVLYDSDITSKDVILKNIHDPYTTTILSELCTRNEQLEAC